MKKKCLNEFPGVIVGYYKIGSGLTDLLVMPPLKVFQNLGVL
jgi:hypothetical protein